jgi:hypothetical protein
MVKNKKTHRIDGLLFFSILAYNMAMLDRVGIYPASPGHQAIGAWWLRKDGPLMGPSYFLVKVL